MKHHTIHNRDEDLSRMVVKGTWSRDVLELCSRPKQGSRQVLTFFVYFYFKQNIIFYTCFNANLTTLDFVRDLLLVKIMLLLILLSLASGIFKFYASIFGH
jgi:hypothetical protein